MQRTFDDLGRPLFETTFCILDIETTGGSATQDAITELGAVLYRGGECLGTFQTLINPGAPIPPMIVLLTGITEAMVGPAPRLEAVLPAFLEFVGSAVIVGHNVRFDLGFLNAAARRWGYPQFANPVLDTCSMARRLLRDEVPNMRLGTLARVLRLAHQPSHRALDDALATADLLHALMERVGNLGVTGLDDLLELPTLRGSAQGDKLRLTTHLPRKPGVYVFRDERGRVLYVGKATNLRSRVRSYFSTETRRKVGPLLRELAAIDVETHDTELAASVRELRLIREHQPPYNQQLRHIAKYSYVSFNPLEPWARLRITSRPKPDGTTIFIGPLGSRQRAQLVVDALWSAAPVRRCTARVSSKGLPTRDGACPSAQLGVAACPCARTVTLDEYHEVVDSLARSLLGDPSPLLVPLQERIEALARTERFEEAANARDRAHALSDALRTQRCLHLLRSSGALTVEWRGQVVRFANGVLAEPQDGFDRETTLINVGPAAVETVPFNAGEVDERKLVLRWIEKHRDELTAVTGELPELDLSWPSFAPRPSTRPTPDRTEASSAPNRSLVSATNGRVASAAASLAADEVRVHAHI